MKKKETRGRPKILKGDDSHFVGCRYPQSHLKLFDKKAKANGQTRSERLQYILREDIGK